MTSPLHIIFNEDIFDDDLGDTFSSRLDGLRLPYLQAKNLVQFDLLLALLPDNLDVYLWVHPNNSLKKSQDLDTTNQEDIAFTLKEIGLIKFQLVTRMPNPETDSLAETLGVPVCKLGNMWSLSKSLPAQKISYLKSIRKIENSFDFNSNSNDYEFAIISALYDDEHESLLEFLEETKSLTPNNSIKEFLIKGSSKKVIGAFQNEMGMVDGTYLATYIANTYKPKYIFMNGVCGGRKSKNINLCDLIIPNKIFDYQTGKLDKGVFKPYLRSTPIDVSLIKTYHKQILIKMQQECSIAWRHDVAKIKCYFNSMACGSKVIKTDTVLEKQITKIDSQVTSVDMESYGIARSIELTKNNNIQVFIVKSVMDFTDENKSDDVKLKAAYLSSLFTIILIRDFL